MGNISHIDDHASVLEEGRHGWAAPFDTSGNLMHLPKDERRVAKQRRRACHEKMRRAEAVRATWTPEQFAEEEARLRAEIDAWAKGQRNAA